MTSSSALSQSARHRFLTIEGIALLLAAPFLIFPTVVPFGAAAACGGLITIWLVQRVRVGQWIVPASPLRLVMCVWLITVGVGVLVSADSDLTYPKATNLLLGFAAWRYATIAIKTQRQLIVGLAVYLLIGASFVAVGVLSTSWLDKIDAIAALTRRLPTPLLPLPGNAAAGVHPNQLAGTLTLYVPLLAALWLSPKPRRSLTVPLLLLGSLLFGGTLLLTQSRSAWIATALAATAVVVWLLLLNTTSRRLTVAVAAVSGLLMLVGAGVLVMQPERLTALLTDPPVDTALGSFSTLGFRQEVWQWALAAIGDFPLTGSGLGSFRRVVYRLYPIQIPMTYDMGHAHNLFLQVALDTGLPGLIAYVALLLSAVGMSLATARRWISVRPIVVGLCTSLLALHIYGLTDALAPGSKTGVIFWLGLGLITAAYQQSKNTANLPPNAG